MGDVIYLKDGTKEETDKVWEQEGYIHFILKGTQSVEIRYSKEIIDRIESDRETPLSVLQGGRDSASTTVNERAGETEEGGTEKMPGAASQDAEKRPAGAAAQGVSGKSMAVITPPVNPDTQKGTLFYDPRRPMKYWASSESRHASYDDALDALAGLYQQPRQWVERHMGETNDLEMLHTNLMTALKNVAMPTPKVIPQETAPEGSITVPETDATPIDDQEADPSTFQTPTTGQLEDAELETYKGLPFYDPRRPKKFWVTNDAQYDTLTGAMKALGRQYGVSVKWVETHMGKTNDLAEIHRNLMKSISAEP